MSLLEHIIRKKKNLAPSSTTVTKLSGEKILVTRDSSGNVKQAKISEGHLGFIEDNSPDLQVAKILDYLTLGSQDVVARPDILRRYNISHVLSIGVRPQEEIQGIVYKYIELLDLPSADLLNVLPECNEFICSARDMGGRVFLHCNAGCSRAPSVAIGHLIYCQKYTAADACYYLAGKRYIRPNEGFLWQLKCYEKEVKKKIP